MMRIVEKTTEQLILKGTPGSVHWMVFATLLGVLFMAVSGWFACVSLGDTGGYLQLIPLGIGFLIGVAFFLIGLVTLAVGRMQLVLNRVSGEGRYDVYSPVIDVGKPCLFRLEDIDSVAIERHQEDRPDSDERGRFPVNVCRARLRIRKPRRAIVLDETENRRDLRVQAVAEEVAVWLEVDISIQS
jgi:hypothetical protein